MNTDIESFYYCNRFFPSDKSICNLNNTIENHNQYSVLGRIERGTQYQF